MNIASLPAALNAADFRIKDPGSGGTIRANGMWGICQLVSAGAEARALPIPVKAGQELTIAGKTIAGTVTVTVASAFNEDGDTTFTVTEAGQWYLLKSFEIAAGTFAWRKIADYASTNLSPTEAAFLLGITAGTGLASKALVLDANGVVALPAGGSIDSRNDEVVTAANVITAAENGRTFYLSAVGGFQSDLPAPALGLEFTFIVKTAPTGAAYTIVTNGSANIMYGHMVERAGGAGVAGAARDIFSFIHNQAIIGDKVVFKSDGVNWYYEGMTDVAAGSTVGQTP